jgi:hypothetical protein
VREWDLFERSIKKIMGDGTLMQRTLQGEKTSLNVPHDGHGRKPWGKDIDGNKMANTRIYIYI